MIKNISISMLAIGFIASLLYPSLTVAAKKTFVSIGTAGITGVYYPTGGAICRMVNKGRKTHGVRCSVESTNGSVFNISAIRSNKLELGIVQSDWQYHAFNGTSQYKDSGPFKELRSLFSLHSDMGTLVVRADSGINSIKDISGKRMNIGEPGSGTSATYKVMAKYLNIKSSDFKKISQYKTSDVAKALCDNIIDAFIIWVGQPSSVIKEASTCGAKLLNINSAEISKMIAENSFYRELSIPAGLYPGNPKQINSFGVSATLVTSSTVSDDTIYHVVKGVFDNLNKFKKLHPALAYLKEKEMFSGVLTAPLHKGAIKYYKERGWM